MATGGIVIAVVMLLLLPVAVMVVGAIWSGVVGWLLADDAERRSSSTVEGS